MTSQVSRYRSTIDGRTIVYELLSDSLVLKQTRYGERRVLYELKECTDNPDRGTRLVDVTDAVKRGLPQHWATFKRRSNGTPLFTLFSASNEPAEPFETFVADVIAAIKRHSGAIPPSLETGIMVAETRRDGAGLAIQDTSALLRTGQWSDSLFGHDAWSCVCQLWPDRLLLQHTRGSECASEWMEFRYCDVEPACAVASRRYWIRRQAMFRHCGGGRPYIALATAANFHDAIDFVIAMRRAEKWQAEPAAASGDEFERFVATVIACIKRMHNPGLASSIRAEPG